MSKFRNKINLSKLLHTKIRKRFFASSIFILCIVLLGRYNFAQVSQQVSTPATTTTTTTTPVSTTTTPITIPTTITPSTTTPTETTITPITTTTPTSTTTTTTLPNASVGQNTPVVTTTPTMAPPESITTTTTIPVSRTETVNRENRDYDVHKPVRYSGKISFYFQSVPTKTLLQLIGKNSGLNFLISDKVQGTTTLNLKDVTWRQALDIIMQANGLGIREMSNAIYISTLDDIAKMQAKEFQAAQDTINMAPLSTVIIPLKYSNAQNIAKVLRSSEGSLLTTRGNIAINNPTNTIIIRDVSNNLKQIQSYIRKLDIPTRQVSIEARIVNIDTKYENQLGVRFGVTHAHKPITTTGSLAGANQLRQGINPVDVTPLDQRLNFNLPAGLLSSGASSIPGSIGLALAKLGPVLLDLELSALEEEGHSQTIAKPRVVTANQQKAIILTGEEIPYQQATSSGATSVEFKQAVLSLEIVPQITPDNKIILKLKAHQDTRGNQLLVQQQQTSGSTTGTTTTVTSIPAVFGPPTINTQQVESQVLLANNETVVIGGVYKLSKKNTIDRVPFFGSLPVIGGLFRHSGVQNEKSELLIFLTPKIINEGDMK